MGGKSLTVIGAVILIILAALTGHAMREAEEESELYQESRRMRLRSLGREGWQD